MLSHRLQSEESTAKHMLSRVATTHSVRLLLRFIVEDRVVFVVVVLDRHRYNLTIDGAYLQRNLA